MHVINRKIYVLLPFLEMMAACKDQFRAGNFLLNYDDAKAFAICKVRLPLFRNLSVKSKNVNISVK